MHVNQPTPPHQPSATFLGRNLPVWAGITIGLLCCGLLRAEDAAPSAANEQKAGEVGNKPLIEDRIIFNWHNFLSSCSTWDLADWLKWVDESHKMGVHFAFAFDTEQGNPQELIMMLPESARFQSEEGLWLANPDSPEGYAYYKAAVDSWLDAYPEISKIVVFARYGATAWSSLDKVLPAAWREEYKEVSARLPEEFVNHKDYKYAPGLFAYSKVVGAIERALKERGSDARVGVGTWGFYFLPAFDTFLPKHIGYYGIDYESLYGIPQLGSPERRAPLKALGGSRPLYPISWAHHDDGKHLGRPFTPFSDFTAKLEDAKG